jgi:hypothetical protein
MTYFFLRFFAIPLALVAWLIYQLIAKNKKWNDIRHDAAVIFIFSGIWMFLAYLMMS